MRNTAKFAGILTLLALIAGIGLFFGGCSEPESPVIPVQETGGSAVSVTGVTLDQASLVLTAGSTGNLSATVQPDNAANKSVNWTSSDASIASVSNGTVTARAAGTAVITVATADGGKMAICTVTVNPAIIDLAFSNVSANGSPSQTTTALTLTFSREIEGLTAEHITLSGVSGVNKGTLNGSGTTYILPISGFTAGGTLDVSVASPPGYNVSGSPKQAGIFFDKPPVNVSLNSVAANGSSSQTTTQLILTFSQAISGLTANDITLSGVSGVQKGILSESGAICTLPISGFTAGGTLSVSVASPAGYSVSGSPKQASIYLYRLIGPSDMVRINAGTFQMGSPSSEPGRWDDETQHTVTLSQGFYMGKYQVTQVQYRAVMGSNPASGYGAGDNYPVYGVSWYDAIVFCNKLSMAEGLTPAYRIIGSTDPSAWGTVPTNSSNSTWNAATIVIGSTGYRLPTEAQWEYACRAGTTTAYNTGDAISGNTGWYQDNSGSTTHPVGQKPANAWGLYDMHGNVFEWCQDWHGGYASGAQTDPAGAVSGGYRVIRGGSWSSGHQNLRSAYRGSSSPYNRGYNVGFRLVRP